MSPRDLAEDLAYVRTIAEEGRQAPLLGGSFLTFWGVLNAAAWMAQWALLHDLLVANPDWHFAALWSAYGVVAGIGTVLLGARVKGMPGRSAFGNRVEGAVWSGMGMGLGAVAVGAIGHMILSRNPPAVDVIVPSAFALYGVALMVTGTVSKERWLSAYAVASWGLSVILGVFLSSDWFYLAGAAGALTILLAPGLILLRKEPSTTV